MPKIKLLKPHTHANQPYPQHATLDIEAAGLTVPFIEWLVGNGIAEWVPEPEPAAESKKPKPQPKPTEE